MGPIFEAVGELSPKAVANVAKGSVKRLILLGPAPLPRECSTTELRQRPDAGGTGREARSRVRTLHLHGSAAVIATGQGLSASAVTSARPVHGCEGAGRVL